MALSAAHFSLGSFCIISLKNKQECLHSSTLALTMMVEEQKQLKRMYFYIPEASLICFITLCPNQILTTTRTKKDAPFFGKA